MAKALDFTLDAYAACLTRTRAHYPVMGFEILDEPDLAERCFCLIRHDIDMSPARALEVARIEAEQGVRATYMVLLSGAFYSPFERDTRDTIAAIADLGHDIALHFDAAWHGIAGEADLTEAVAWEAAMLKRLFGDSAARAFSFHNTTDFTMTCKAPSYAGLWNAYAGALQDTVSYVSDSNGHWRFRTWAEALEEHPDRLQILTHPEWWTDEPGEPADKACSLLRERALRAWLDYAALLHANARENLASVPEAVRVQEESRSSEIGELVLTWLSGRREEALLELTRRLGAPTAQTQPLRAAADRMLAESTVDPIEMGSLFGAGLRQLAAHGMQNREWTR